MLEVHRDIVASDVRCHGDYRRGVELSDQVASRNSIQVRHDDVHQHQIVFRASVHLVHSFQTVKLLRVSTVTR